MLSRDRFSQEDEYWTHLEWNLRGDIVRVPEIWIEFSKKKITLGIAFVRLNVIHD